MLADEGAISRFKCVQKVVPTETGILAARDRAMHAFRRLDLNDQDLFAIEVSLQEALVNALLHGVAECLASHIWLSYELDAQRLCITVEDNGSGQDHWSGRRTGTGLGLPLVHALMSRVTITAGGHCICMELDRSQTVGQVGTQSYR